ncbi:MAG: PD40 domain-containing protein [Bacteroidetes bacterium]|nr:PD40 domain-containing protein [Bacteroidota bacterium]
MRIGQSLLVAVFCSCLCSPLWAQKFVSKIEKAELKKAEEFLKYEEYNNAITHLMNAYVENPARVQTRFLLGMAYFEAGQKNKALEHFDFVVKQEPLHDARLNSYYARTLHFNLKFQEAKTYYLKEIAKYMITDPEYADLENRIRQCDNAGKLVANPVEVRIENVGGSINTPYSDFAPVITTDESILIFTSRRPGNKGTIAYDNKPYEDIYISEFRDGNWTPGINIGDPINTGTHDASIALAPDGRTMFIYRDSNKGGIYMTRKKAGVWSIPQAIEKPIRSKYTERSICMSADERIVIFESDRPGGYGGRDLYYCEKQADGSWGEAVNLGPKINTAFDEDGPFLHPDGQTLYFSSKGHNSMGGYDIFKTTWRADKSFTSPANLGYPINTPDDDIYIVVSASGRTAYYSSAREGGFGDDDIYKISWLEPKKQDTLIAIVPDDDYTPIIPQVNLTLLKGTVTDAETGKTLSAKLVLVDNEKNDTLSIFETDEETGRYLITLPAGKNYGITAISEGYLFTSENVTIPKMDGYHEVTKDLQLHRLKVGQKIVLRNIFYDFDKATLRPESVAELQRLLKILGENPRMRIRLLSHTDSKGSDDYNQKLSEARAKSVVSWLIEQGVPMARLEFKGIGESSPIDTNDTEEGRQNNRRTEFEIISND